MTTYDNQPPPFGWAPDCRCGVCCTCLPVPTIPANVQLGEN